MPGRYSREIAIMEHMKWSWSDLQSAPAVLVEELWERIRASAHWRAQKSEQDRMKNGI